MITLGLWTEARSLLDDLLKKSPADSELIHQSVEVAEAMSDRENLISALETSTLLEPDNNELVRKLAESYDEDSDWANAFDTYDALIHENGSSETADWLGYAKAALKNGNTPIAIEYAEKVLEILPDDGRALAILGYAHHKKGETEKALDFLERSVTLAPDAVEPWLLISELHREKGEFAKSIEVLQTAKNTFPDSRLIHFELAKEQLQQGQAAAALATLQETVAGNTADLETSLLMIQAQKALNLSDSSGLIEKTYQAFKSSPEATYEYARLKLENGDRATCADLLEPIIINTGAPTDWKLTYADAVVGENYRNIHQNTLPATAQVQAAKEILTETLLENPENIYAKALTAELAIKEDQAAKAFEFLTNLLKDNGTGNSNWFDRIKAGFAWAANILQKFDLALAAIQNIVEAHPDWAAARQTLAEIDQATGEISDAVDQANQVLEIAPDVAQSVEWFANFMSNLGKQDEAEKSIQALIKNHKDKLPLFVKLAEMKLLHNDKSEARNISENIKRSLPKAKQDKEIVRAAIVFDQLDDTQAVMDALKLRFAQHNIPQEVSLTDFAGYQRSKEKYSEAIKVIDEAEQKLGHQKWLELIKAETLHAAGNTSEAFDLLNSLPESNQHHPDIKDLAFIPNDWQGLLSEEASVETLEQALAFESGNYQTVLDQANDKTVNSNNQVVKIESDYAMGSGKQLLPWLDCTAENETVYQDSTLAAQVSELLLDSGQVQTAGEILMRALELYPQDAVLKLCASRQAAMSSDWQTAEALFEQEIGSFSSEPKIVSAKKVCETRNLVKTAMALNHWPLAEAWSKQLFEQQPKNWTAELTRLQVLVKGVEFFIQNQEMGLKQHVFTESAAESGRSELAAMLAKFESVKNSEAEHWVARGKVVLEPSQANIRRLALITPEPDDLAAMMMALDRSGQNQTALQLGKKA